MSDAAAAVGENEGEWDPWMGFEPGDWEELETFRIDSDWHRRAVEALEPGSGVTDALGGHAHPGALALLILSKLSALSDERSARPERPRQISVHLRQMCRQESPIQVGEDLILSGRIASKTYEPKPTMVREGRVTGADGSVKFLYRQTSRLVEVKRMAS